MIMTGQIERRLKDLDEEIIDAGLDLEDMAADPKVTDVQITGRMAALQRLREIRHAIAGELQA